MRLDNLILVGFMGSGKTAVAKALGVLLPDYQQTDLDTDIETMAGISIAQIFEGHGEAYFRTLETKALKAAAQMTHQIISTGGGIVLMDPNRPLLKKSGVVFWLTASPSVIYDRIKNEKQRPLINTSASRKQVLTRIETILDSRFERYNEVADVIINTDSLTIRQIAKDIRDEYERLRSCLK